MGLDGQVGRVIGTIMTVSGIFLLIDAWFRLRHRVFADLTPLAVVAIWSLPLLISPPIFRHKYTLLLITYLPKHARIPDPPKLESNV